ncbi:hypothetical protein [Laceyella putida]|uniref:DUF5348 domain-containing protein n=1 Tax=Laceyella putida TaxID=110101 RepID=A0ABW2RJQ3_9BACL
MSQFLQQLMKKRKKSGVRIGYNEKSTCGLSKFHLTLDHFKDGDYVTEANGLTIYYREDVVPHLHRLHISYKNGRFELRAVDHSL